MIRPRLRQTGALLVSAALAGCNLAPSYRPPTMAAAPAAFKEAPGWSLAAPSDAVAKGEWWTLFGDPQLDALAAKVAVSNQTVAQYRAAWSEARAATRGARAAQFPTVTGGVGATRSGGSGASSGTKGTEVSAQLSASWEADLWGKLGNGVKEASASAEASAGDLANATLSARGALATDYLELRGIDAQRSLLGATVTAYQKALEITGNKYAAGTVARSDVDTAQAALSGAEADRRDLDRQRAVLEHAIAVLAGENPSTFAIAADPAWTPVVPEVPSALPAQILERRPDIAAAERRVAAANADIGVQRAAYFPQVSLTADGSLSATSVGNLVTAPLSLWSLGMSALGTLLDFGANKAKVDQSRAAFDAAAAAYRQTVLTAFQQVEDNLAAGAAYADEAGMRNTASAAADRAETIARNQYLAGTIDYSSVVVAQTTAYSARQARIQAVIDRQTTAVALILALGGQWK
ncbi:efflux transporter outer membrane subunit [Novosphingobium flavum]|uniref:Efflux transporter outer membrane subunit n=1 Tax=Novosphingobium flavum TaxID=1778672 RepID=A0A7X1KLG3_9SPHN|nr:efflux transporter outer membrane subunit [Novosphingobium flavum]MBC2665263.1 efflux transporter outer membrane subunit [Novosphingobium flavum]